MLSWPILSVVTFLPLVGALLIMLIRGDGEAGTRNARWIALWTTLVTFAVSLLLVWHFDPASAGIPVRREACPGSAAPSPTTWASTASRCRS